MISMELWINEMVKTSSHTASFKYYDSPIEMAADFNAGKLDYATAQGLDFVKYFKKSNIADGFSGGMDNPDDENLVIIVPHDTNVQSIDEINNPIIAVQKNDNLAKLYAQTQIPQNNQITFLETKKRSAAILKLFFKKADAAIVVKKTFDFAKELNPQIGKKLKILKYSSIPARAFGFYRKGYDKELQTEITKKAFDLVESVRGKQMMAIFQTNTLVKLKVEDLKPIEKLYNEYLELKKGKK